MSDIATMLHDAGLKATPGRVRALAALLAAVRPLSHADLEAQLPDADRVTLYRILNALVEHGLATKAADAHGVFRFTAAGSLRPHDGHAHFRCTDCGGVFCLDAPPPAPPKLPRGFRLGMVDLDISGVCARCNRTKGGAHHGKA